MEAIAEVTMLQFQNSITVADIINTLLLLAAVVGIFLTYRQIQQTSKTQRATYFKDLYSMMFSDPDIRKAYQQVEYDKFVYDDTFHGSESEHSIDRLLSFADLVCYLYDNKMLTENEMRAFKYELLRVYTNVGIQRYLTFLEQFYFQNRTGTEPFQRFVSYCESMFPEGETRAFNRKTRSDSTDTHPK
jgi:hypothetical protein